MSDTPRMDSIYFNTGEGVEPGQFALNVYERGCAIERELHDVERRLAHAFADNLIELHDRHQSAASALQDALAELVRLKNIKERIDKAMASVAERESYREGKERAWHRARELVGSVTGKVDGQQ